VSGVRDTAGRDTGRLARAVPTLDWSQRAAAGELEGLDWVDTDDSPGRPAFRQREDGAGRRRFRHLPYTSFQPPPIRTAAREARRVGRSTAHEALLLVFARTEWQVAARDWLWTPLSSAPKLLASLAEAYGIDPDLHRHDPEVLPRLVALLPAWYPLRGTVERALVLLRVARSPERGTPMATLRDDGPEPDAPPLRDELFACRSARWWRRRGTAKARPAYQIVDGWLRFQPPEGQGAYGLQQEDVLIEWKPGRAVPRNLMRLLPVWSDFRLTVPRKS